MKNAYRRLKIAVMILAILSVAMPLSAQFDAGNLGQENNNFGSVVGGERDPVSIQAQFTSPTDGKPCYLFITATIEPGWHIYSITQPTAKAGNPTVSKIEVKPPEGVRIPGEFRPTVAPHKTKEPDAYPGLPIETHSGIVTWYAPIELDEGVVPSKIKIEGTIHYGACSDASCLPPKTTPFSAALGKGLPLSSENAMPDAAEQATPFPAAAPTAAKNATAAPAAPEAKMDWETLMLQLAVAFCGGLILNLMPCVLPVISLKILTFFQQAGEDRGRVFTLNLWYSLGMISVFMVLAALASGVGLAAGERFGWGEQFTLPWFKIAMTALVFVMALSLLGVWEIPIPGFFGTGKANELQAKEGPAGAFFKGVFTTVLATPCSGPLLGLVFGYVLKQPPSTAYFIFGAMGLGMAAPYLAIGAFPELLRFLPKPGAWMDTFKQLMGFLLLATVVYLFNALTSRYFVPTLALLVGLWFACWWIGRTSVLASMLEKTVAWCGGLTVATLVGYLAFILLLQESIIPWQPFSPAALKRARAEGKTVMVDFTANWCPNCKWNSKVAIETEAVAKRVKENGVVPLLADWTDESETIKKAINDLGYNSIPLFVIWPGDPGKDVIKKGDIITEGWVLESLQKAGPSKKH
jgi:thiol:disulfide interchange protein